LVIFSLRLFASVWLFLFLASVFRGIPGVQAHGGGTPVLTNEEIGPYWISVWVQPYPPRPDNFHLTVALSEPGAISEQFKEAGPPVLDATVEVKLRLVAEPEETVSALATHDNAENKFLYEVDVFTLHTGDWEAAIAVTGLDGGSGTIRFPIEVVSASPLPLPWLIMGATIIFFIAAWWLIRRQPQAEEISR
jgi:hypothetical protein